MFSFDLTGGVGNLDSLHIPHPPRRVVSLVPSLTETLFHFGLGDRVVGVTDFCIYPAEAKRRPKVGGTKTVDVRRVMAALPDLILANQEENRREDVEALQAAGFKVWVTYPRTAQEAFELMWAIVRVFNIPQMGKPLEVLERTYEWANLAAESLEAPRVFCPIWREQGETPQWWMTISEDTYAHDFLRLCGGINIFADKCPFQSPRDKTPEAGAPAPDRYPRVTLDEIIARAPEVILLPSEPYAFNEGDRQFFEALPAFEHTRILQVDGSFLTWHGIRFAQALGEVTALLSAPAADSISETE